MVDVLAAIAQCLWIPLVAVGLMVAVKRLDPVLERWVRRWAARRRKPE